MEEDKPVLRSRRKNLSKTQFLNYIREILPQNCSIHLSEIGASKTQYSLVVYTESEETPSTEGEVWGYYEEKE